MSQHVLPTDDSKQALDPTPSSSQRGSSEQSQQTQQPTVVFLIPYPPLRDTVHRKHDSPPFLIYAPLQQKLVKPAEGQKESLPHKAMRKWQSEETKAEAKGTGFKAKAVKVYTHHSITKNTLIYVNSLSGKGCRQPRIAGSSSSSEHPRKIASQRYSISTSLVNEIHLRSACTAAYFLSFRLSP